MMRFMRRSKDLGIEGTMARWYDKNTRRHRMDEMKSYANEVAAYLKNGDSVLEVAPGPGFLAIELARTRAARLGQYEIVGLDISKDFVAIAKQNAREAGVEVDFQQGNVAGMPFPDNRFDYIICTAAFKNFKEPFKALGEMYRVLKPGGVALIIDMNRNVSNQEIEALIKDIKGFDAFFMRLTFKHFLRKGAYSKEELESLALKTAFKEYEIIEKGVGFYMYLRK